MEVKKDILWRVYLSFLCIVLICLAIIGRAFFIQQIEGNYWKSMSDSLHTRIVDIEAERGTIYSDDGEMLSTSIPEFDLYMDFGAEGLREKKGKKFFDNIDALCLSLSKFFGDKSAARYKKEFLAAYKKKDRYHLLQRKVSFEDYQVVRAFPLFNYGKNKGGFIAEVRTRRLTPYGLLANRTIGLSRGYVNEKGKRVFTNVGLERSYDSVLRGTMGKKLVRYIAGGVLMPVEGYEIDPENGKDVYTTIDVKTQDIAENALMNMMVNNQALEGTCVVMEVATGKIKAVANLGRMPDGNYYEKDNYAVRTSEPGSTIKLITLLSALKDKIVSIDDKIEIDGGKWNLNGRTIVDDHHGPQFCTVKEAFYNSSNVAMSKMAYMNYINQPEKYYKHFKELRLTQRTGVDLKEEFFPTVKNPADRRRWHYQTLASMGFGYEVMLSPLQLLMVYNAVANNGKMMKPYLVKEIRYMGVPLEQFEPTVLNEKIADDATLGQLRECLEAVCTIGTGKNNFKDAAYKAAGKTGTAKVNDGKFTYADNVYQSAFAGYFPADHPRYSCIVVIKNRPGAATYYGGSVAAPVFREVADKLYALDTPGLYEEKSPEDTTGYFAFGLKPDIRALLGQFNYKPGNTGVQNKDAEWSAGFIKDNIVSVNDETLSDTTLPDFTGWGIKDVVYLAENKGLKVIVNGKGKVIAQSIQAGTEIRNGQTLYITLN